jgi:dihydropteroate synthase
MSQRGLELARLLARVPQVPSPQVPSPQVMGVLNVTPDSFSDGGEFLALEAALAQGRALLEAGAVVLDVGGESTRPGAAPVPPSQEQARVVPVIEALRQAHPEAVISIDTRRAAVAEAALAAGADLVNDVSGLADPGMIAVCAARSAPLILGHIQGLPETMQEDPSYEDVVNEVCSALEAGAARARAAGVEVLVDPGIGFGKTTEHNLALLASVSRLRDLGPVVIGVSRKSLLGTLTGRPVDERLAGGLGAAVAVALAGASLIRTHDVAETCDALRVAWAIRAADPGVATEREVARVR